MGLQVLLDANLFINTKYHKIHITHIYINMYIHTYIYLYNIYNINYIIYNILIYIIYNSGDIRLAKKNEKRGCFFHLHIVVLASKYLPQCYV